MSSNPTPDKQSIGAFDIRFIIGGLLGLYGLILLLLGLFNNTSAELDRGDGLNINLWAGLGMIVVSAAFGLWAWKKPLVIVVPKEDPAAPK